MDARTTAQRILQRSTPRARRAFVAKPSPLRASRVTLRSDDFDAMTLPFAPGDTLRSILAGLSLPVDRFHWFADDEAVACPIDVDRALVGGTHDFLGKQPRVGNIHRLSLLLWTYAHGWDDRLRPACLAHVPHTVLIQTLVEHLNRAVTMTYACSTLDVVTALIMERQWERASPHVGSMTIVSPWTR